MAVLSRIGLGPFAPASLLAGGHRPLRAGVFLRADPGAATRPDAG